MKDSRPWQRGRVSAVRECFVGMERDRGRDIEDDDRCVPALKPQTLTLLVRHRTEQFCHRDPGVFDHLDQWITCRGDEFDGHQHLLACLDLRLRPLGRRLGADHARFLSVAQNQRTAARDVATLAGQSHFVGVLGPLRLVLGALGMGVVDRHTVERNRSPRSRSMNHQGRFAVRHPPTHGLERSRLQRR